MATPRRLLIDPERPMYYHLVSRCVRSSWLCGFDQHSRRDYEHRKTWIQERLFRLARYFAVAIDAYAIMSNHFHLVVYFDPQESYRWSDAEVVERWLAAFPPRVSVLPESEQTLILNTHREILLQTPAKLQHARETLGSVSMFMKYLKQPIAYQANREDSCSGHFFEGRFYSGALLDENAVVAAMAYVDLNPVRASILQRIENYRSSSGYKRSRVARNTPERLKEAVKPLVSGLSRSRITLAITLGQYLNILENCQQDYLAPNITDRKSRWFNRVASIKKRQRAFGSNTELSHWRTERGWSVLGSPLPDA
ncbi:MAG: REP element-mobilizing transposase RayT [Candidatus Azotimanducaceae bacterium]|jgi:REP element-mobilizing transposase RayT